MRSGFRQSMPQDVQPQFSVLYHAEKAGLSRGLMGAYAVLIQVGEFV